MPEFEYIFHF